MIARLLGALLFGFSTRSVTRTTSSSAVASTAAQPYNWICDGSTSISAMTLPPSRSCTSTMRDKQRVALVDQVVAEQHRERLVADVLRRAQHGVAEARRVALAHVVHRRQVGRLVHERQPLVVPLGARASSSSS